MSANIGRIPRSWLSSEDAVYSPWPMFHVTGRSPMMSMADVGGRVVLRERLSRADFWPDVRAHRCTSATVGAAVPLLLAEPERDDDTDNPLRIVLFGRVGQDGRRFLDRFGATGISFYGSTEVGFPIGNRPIEPGAEHLAGRLRPGYEGRVVDDAGNDVTTGRVGQLWIKPPDRRLILREYLNQPQRTADAIVDGWYRTGDAFRQHPDGSFEFVDRITDTIRRFGENISSAALESAVMGDCGVLECAAVGVASTVTGQDVLLLVIPQPGVVLDAAQFAERLADLLPRYMRPTYIAVVDELPRTPNGKIRKVGLAEATDLTTVWQARR
jgi:crotonobetaine/carnitine-CoA ligase